MHFNGAALFQVRKLVETLNNMIAEYLLQWGRTFSSAEINAKKGTGTMDELLQWGRTFSSAEMEFPQTCSATACGLQWGRTFSSAEIHKLVLLVVQK